MTIKEDIKYVFSQTGAKDVGGALGGIGSVVRNITSLVNPMNLALGAVGGGALYGIVTAGSKYEDLRIQMAQTMRFMGRGGNTFADSLRSAEQTMDAINTAAAALPGEAEDYQIALQMAGADVMRATGGYQTSFDLIKNMTAIGVSLGRGSQETAQMLSRSMNTQRGMLEMGNDYTVQLLNSMKQLPGLANITAESFNKMRLEQRVHIMQGLVGQYSDMINASSHTWGAISGAFTSLAAKIVRLSTAKVFAGMAKGLEIVNGMFSDADGNLTDFASLIIRVGDMVGTVIGGAFEKIASVIADMSTRTQGWLRQLANSPLVAMFDRIGSAMMQIGAHISERSGGAGAVGTAASAVGTGVAVAGLASAEVALFGPLAMILIPLTMGFANFLTNTEAVSATLESLSALVEPAAGVLGTMFSAFSSLSGMLGGLISGIMPGLAAGLAGVGGAVLEFYAHFMRIVDFVSSSLAPGMAALGRGIGAVLRGVGSVLVPVIRLVGGIFLGIYDIALRFLMPAINAVVGGLGMFIEKIGELLSWIGGLLGNAVESLMPTAGVGEAESTRAMRDMLNSFTTSLEGAGGAAIGDTAGAGAAAAARPTPGGRGGGVTQDFRNSRFSIQQKFEEGFDPDRIAAAFATDLGRIGERRLQSGLEPAFGVR